MVPNLYPTLRMVVVLCYNASLHICQLFDHTFLPACIFFHDLRTLCVFQPYINGQQYCLNSKSGIKLRMYPVLTDKASYLVCNKNVCNTNNHELLIS